MNLSDFLEKKEKPPELYWSIVIEEGWVQAGVWYIGADKAEVINVSSPAAWEMEEELVGAVDTSLSSSVQKLPEEYKEPSKTVFGVSSSWVKNGEISEERLGAIKKVCTDLSLTPVGFVVLPEAIAHLYKSEEGTPVNAVVLGLGVEFLEISVFKLGNLVGTTQVSRSVSLTDDVVEGLSRFEGAAPLPSRFIVFDGKEAQLEEAKESLMQASWDQIEKIKFLHTPNVETLSPDRKVLAVSLAGANEIGDITQIESKEELNDDLKVEEVVNVSEPENKTTAEDLGFVIGEDVVVKEPPVYISQPIHQPIPIQISQEQVVAKVPETSSGQDYLQKTKNIFHGFSTKYFSSKPNISFGSKKPVYVFLSLLVILVIGLAIMWWFLPKANVLIYVTPKKFEQETEFTFNSSNSQILNAEVSGEKTKSATGSKTIGDKAKGTVLIENGTAFPINLSAGTIIISSGNLKFSLDNAASVSAGISTRVPSTATVTVTSDSIGAEYNLAKDEVYKVGNYPKVEVDAVATTDFSGGNSTQILAVSKEDQTKLEEDLKNELRESAISQLSQKLISNQIFVNDVATLSATKRVFDHKVGDQADSLKLSLTLKAVGLAADREKLYEYARGVLKDKVPSGFVLRDSQINFGFVFIDEKDGNFNYKITMSANFLPNVDVNNIIKQISGKDPQVVENYLSKIPGFSRAGVTLKPRLPGFLGILPHVSKNITIEVSAEE